MPYCDDLIEFWHIDAHDNILSPACFDSFCKVENWEPAYQICCCLLSSWQQLLQRETSNFITPDLWPPNSPDLNTVVYRICGVLLERIYRKSVKNWILINWCGFWLKRGLAFSQCRWSGNDQWRVHLNACVKAKRKHFENMLWCAVPQMSIICYETYIQLFFVSQLLTKFKLALVVEHNFWHVYWISYCKKYILGQQMWNFYTVLLQIHSGNLLQKNWHTRPQLD